jgi:hypothetical protein
LLINKVIGGVIAGKKNPLKTDDATGDVQILRWKWISVEENHKKSMI